MSEWQGGYGHHGQDLPHRSNPIAGTATVQCAGGAVAVGTMGTLSTGNTGSTTCAAGQVAVGISGREGDFVDQLAVRCQAADLTGAITTADGYGGSGGPSTAPTTAGQASAWSVSTGRSPTTA